MLLLCGGALPVQAQIRPLAIQNGTLLVGDGRTIERGTILVTNQKIAAVGPEIETPFLARKLDATGKYVTPGLIDLHSTLGLGAGTGGGSATARALDAFDRYARDDLRAALRQGITAVYLPARGDGGVRGLGAVVRLNPAVGLTELTLKEEAALCVSVGLNPAEGPIVRVKTTEELRQRFLAARDYREAWEDYEDALKEYEEKLAERAKKEAAEPAEKSSETQKSAGARGPRRGADKAEPKPEGKPEEKKDELKKPAEPGKDRAAELLLKVLDGELYLRVEAHDPADILNVLELADEYRCALILEGATGAHHVAAPLAERKVPVILSGPIDTVAFRPGWLRYASVAAAARLQAAGVPVYFGSGVVDPGTAPHLALRVARAVGAGFPADGAVERLTGDAARLLGVDDEIGMLKAGVWADLVVWSDHPLAPEAVIERVYVGGHEVYHATSKEAQE